MNNTKVNKIAGMRCFEIASEPKSLKKITGTRLSKVIDCNHWSDPFQAWCEIFRVAEPPFEGNKYTNAGQIIEPKLIEYCKGFVSPYLVTPNEYYKTTKKLFDVYGDNDIFGGVWDALAFSVPNASCDTNDKPIAVIECKTSSRPQDWTYGIPENYKAQGLMYAYLLGVTDIYYPVAFLEPKDYDNPEAFVCSEHNTRVFHLTIDSAIGTFENIEEAMAYAASWLEYYNDVSPEYDERKDKDYLDIIRTVSDEDLGVDVNDLSQLCDMLYEIDTLIEELERKTELNDWKKKRSAVTKAIGDLIKPKFDNPDFDKLETENYIFKVSNTRKVDYDKMLEDGVYDKYVTTSKSMTTKKKD